MSRDASSSKKGTGAAVGDGPPAPAKKRVPVAALDEKKINAPSIPDLVMLSTICLATLIFWAAGRAACNYHVPGESLTPRAVSLEERTRSPKGVGVEFAQALGGGDFETAAKLSAGAAAEAVQKDKVACGPCTARKQAKEQLLSVGAVLRVNSIDSIVRVRTTGGSTGEVVRVLGIERIERDWRVTRIYNSEKEAELKDAPPTEAMPPLSLTPPPSGAPPEGEPSAEQLSTQP
jgi:hypothetical protein